MIAHHIKKWWSFIPSITWLLNVIDSGAAVMLVAYSGIALGQMARCSESCCGFDCVIQSYTYSRYIYIYVYI